MAAPVGFPPTLHPLKTGVPVIRRRGHENCPPTVSRMGAARRPGPPLDWLRSYGTDASNHTRIPCIRIPLNSRWFGLPYGLGNRQYNSVTCSVKAVVGRSLIDCVRAQLRSPSVVENEKPDSLRGRVWFKRGGEFWLARQSLNQTRSGAIIEGGLKGGRNRLRPRPAIRHATISHRCTFGFLRVYYGGYSW